MELPEIAKELAGFEAPQEFRSVSYFSPMNITEVLTVISALTVVIGIAVSLLNKRIDDTNKRIDELRQDVDKRLDRIEQEMDKRFDKIEQDIREIRQLLYMALEVPRKEDK